MTAVRIAPPRWPDQLLDVDAIAASGWRPAPFREFVAKVHQRCNLSCDYCYVYTMVDQSWRGRPALMPAEVRTATARRIAEHVGRHELADALVVLHGGEPLLAGVDVLTGFVAEIRSAVPASCRLRVGLQTNGTLIDDAAVTALAAARVTVSVSLDGGPAAHDRHRRYAGGAGSHARAVRAIEMLAGAGALGGLLATIDLSQDPVECYEQLLAHRPPAIDFLFPHATWTNPPAGSGYGRWLCRVFDRWYDAPVREVRVRLFQSLLNLLLGGEGGNEQIGLSPMRAVIVESDGAIEQTDALKAAYPGAAATPWNVLTDGFDAALWHPGFVARQLGVDALGPDCRACPVQRVCGGGHYVHRYREPDGFRNPSVYCGDLRILIDHAARRLRADLTGTEHDDPGHSRRPPADLRPLQRGDGGSHGGRPADQSPAEQADAAAAGGR
ncbi:FxsB family cyclophane-forming radical SAM/SPASM peptide maturase [Actinoplanes rectilineatus]|uniref:FxsB family cyclophane-forming radical SAM/SPASM peptide maturase n=1 Tax=Actinoplanes rectilineatus TaxID=113571 RepID=UPI0007C7A132|nr:FxsB family cyclophane-forming radical SAM/SPASM peptide maturase [Actinoplanes rectilineatus]